MTADPVSTSTLTKTPAPPFNGAISTGIVVKPIALIIQPGESQEVRSLLPGRAVDVNTGNQGRVGQFDIRHPGSGGAGGTAGPSGLRSRALRPYSAISRRNSDGDRILIPSGPAIEAGKCLLFPVTIESARAERATSRNIASPGSGRT